MINNKIKIKMNNNLDNNIDEYIKTNLKRSINICFNDNTIMDFKLLAFNKYMFKCKDPDNKEVFIFKHSIKYFNYV